MRQLRKSCIRTRPIYILAKNENQLLPELTEINVLLRSTCSLIVMMHVPHQIIFPLVLNLQHIYSPSRLKPPFSRNDQIRLFVLEKS